MLILIASQYHDRGEELGDEAQPAFEELSTQTRTLGDQLGDGALTVEDIAKIDSWVRDADGRSEALARTALQQFAAKIDSLVPDDAVAFLDQTANELVGGQSMAEKVHRDLIGTNQNDLKALADLIARSKAFSGKVGEYAKTTREYADYVRQVIPAAGSISEFATKVQDLNKKFDEHIKKAEEIYGYALDLATVAELTNTSNGTQMMTDVEAFAVGFKYVDKVVGKLGANVPVFGDLWNQYIKPLTEMCIKQLRKIALLDERQKREWQVYFLMEDQQSGTAKRDATGAPLLHPQLEFEKIFPGGQPVFSYMWHVRNGEKLPLTGPVKEYFLAREDLFNTFPGNEGGKLVGDSNWYDPWSWGQKTNLDDWLVGHFQEIWAMLYGDLGHYIPY